MQASVCHRNDFLLKYRFFELSCATTVARGPKNRMYTALRGTSQSLATFIETRFVMDPNLAVFFDAGLGGKMVVSLNTPDEMAKNFQEGLSVWLYRVVRDDFRLNSLPERVRADLIKPPPLPLRLHYLLTPMTNIKAQTGPETEQVILGKVLQMFHDHPCLVGTDLSGDLTGTDYELNVRLEALNLEEITRVWEALEGSYQLSLSYEVSIVNIESGLEPERISPVLMALPVTGIIVE